ncbi:MAG: FtsX-like permease family protein [Gammaproteobacteria bacterium]|nr:FtsX-like permease family protein [Gammaproteobacteria bacterium]
MRLFCVAVALACAVTFSITLLGDRLEQLFDAQSKEVLAADIVLQSSTEINSQQENIIDQFELRHARTLTFQTMANPEDGEGFLLSSVKAVTNGYPLLGELQTAYKQFGVPSGTQDIPMVGQVWVEDRILNELNLQLSQFINIGEASLKITRVLVYEPDRGNSFYSFTPRIMMNWSDVDATKVVKPGSRVKYRYLFAGNQDKLFDLKSKLSETLQLNQQFVSVDQANQTLTNTLERAYRFLNITALIAILLGAIAAALVSFQYANEMTYQYALLRCLGMQGKHMVGAVTFPIIVFFLLAIIIGFVVGGGAHLIILRALGNLVPETLPGPSIKPFILSALTALIVVVSFACPFIYNLLKTAPKLLLNRMEVQRQPIGITLASMLLGLSCLIYLGTRDALISIYILAVLLVFVLIAYIVTRYFISWYGVLVQKKFISMNLTARSLKANKYMVVIQVIAIALTIFSLAIISTIRDDLVSSWQSKIPDNAPNIFAINLFDHDRKKFLSELTRLDIDSSDLYPIVRGRLSAINDNEIRQYVSKDDSRGDEALDRDLALTWANELPKENEILQGIWHSANSGEYKSGVSVEEGIADNLDIKLGDKLSFTVESEVFSAVVTSIRTVEWESFSPNFYMIFSDGVLDDYATTYITSFHIGNEQRSNLADFVKKFPSATFFDVEFLLTRVRGIAEKISYAVEAVLYFAILSSILVFISIEMILRKYRIYSAAIFKALGANTKLIHKVFRSEFILIGVIAGSTAYLLNVIISYVIANYIIEGQFIFNIKTTILCLVITPILVLAAGYISVRRTKNVSVKKLLILN